MLNSQNPDLQDRQKGEERWTRGIEDPTYLNYWLGYIGIVEDPALLQKVIERLGRNEEWRKNAINSFSQAGLDFGLLEKTSLNAIDPQEFRVIAQKLTILATPDYRTMPSA